MVATWEFWTLANMMVSTHGDDAERQAGLRLAAAEVHHDSGACVTWREVLAVLPRVRAAIKLRQR